MIELKEPSQTLGIGWQLKDGRKLSFYVTATGLFSFDEIEFIKQMLTSNSGSISMSIEGTYED